jgi:hypothetical protein
MDLEDYREHWNIILVATWARADRD